MRLVLPAAVLVVLAAGCPAAHAARVPCRAITDAVGDGAATVGDAGPGYDIVSADIASDARTVTTVIRVVRITPAGTATNATSYTFAWQYGDKAFETEAWHLTNGDYFEAAVRTIGSVVDDTVRVDVTGVIDPGTGEARVSVPMSFVTKAAPNGGRTFARLNVVTLEEPGVFLPAALPVMGKVLARTGPVIDRAATTVPYALGARNCVASGR
jgi:hypothetical protein